MAHSGKTMTFATDLVPQEDNIYNLGYDNQRWKIYGDLQPLATKIYNAPLYNTSSGANFYQNFATVIPVDYNALWIAHYRITITAEGHSDYTEICDVSISGRSNTYYSYKIYNSIVTYSIYQHMLLESNSASNNQHELGYRIQGSYGAENVAKVVKVELLEQINCTITLLDNLKLYTSATPSGYTWRGFNATSNGLQEAGDSNDFGYYIQSNGFKGKAGSNKVYRYCLFARTGDGTYESFVMQDNTVATTKTVNPHGFVPDGKIYWNANNTVYSEGTLNLSPYQQYHALDYRYSFNFNNTFLPDYCETYVVYTYNEDDGLLYLDTAQWLAAALPTTADGKIYQRIGSKYYTGTSNYYQGSLLLENPYYEYKDGDIRSWSATHLSNITGADDLKAIEVISGTSGLLKKTAANTWTLDTNTYSPTSHNHNSTYLKLDGSNNMAADVNIIAGDTDKFVNFWYNTNKTAGASWRVGMLGSGSGNTNYFVIQSGTSTTSATAWNNALKIGQNNYDIYNNENRIPHTGNATGSVGGTTTPVYVDGGVIKTISYTIAKSVPSDAKFTDTTYSAATNGGLSLSGTAFSITSGGVTNTMLAGSIANGKLANSKVTIAGNDVSLGGSLTASTLIESLGLSKALRFIGVTTTDMTGGTTTNHSWTGTPAGISNYTPKQGDVVINSTKQDEWVCISVSGTTYTWERLGSDTSYKIAQSPVTSATAETSTATTFVYSVTQDANGVITVKTRPLPTYNNYSHPTGDGNLHVPATGTSNNGKVLKAGSTAGSISWGTLTASDVGAAPSSTVSCTTANVKSALGTGSDTTKFLNNKGEWAVPAYTTSLAWSAITSKPNLSTGNARIFYGTSSTAAGTAAKVVTCSIYDAYTAGDILVVKFDNANTAGSPTLNVNSKGAKNIRKIYNGAVNTLNANGEITGTCMFVYDGTQWLLTNADYNNTYTIPTSFTITANATDGLWNLTGTNGTNAVTYALAPYSSKSTTATFYTAAANPTLTTRLNYDGYLYATKLYSGGTEVSVSGHTHSYLSSISWSGDTNLKLKQSVNGATATDVLQFAAGSNITLTGASGKLTIAGTPDTKNTAGSTNSTSKLFLIGATTQAANPTTNSYQYTYTTEGLLSSTQLGLNAAGTEKVHLEWNATDSSLDFVFA